MSKKNQEPRRVYVTKYALTEGIRLCEVKSQSDGYLYVRWSKTTVYEMQLRHQDYRDTLDEARARSMEMAAKRLKSLDKQRKTLETIARDGAKVAER